MIQPVGAFILVFTTIWLAACSGGSDNNNSPQSGAPPGSNTPQATGQAGRFDGPVIAIVHVPNGNGDVYVAGGFTTYNNQPVRPVVRLRPNGTLNDSFNLTDAVTAPAPGSVLTGIAAADDGTGGLYVSEQIALADPRPPWTTARLWKVDSTGAIATGFPSGELTYTDHPLDSPATIVFAMAPVGDGSGRVYLAGVFDTYNETPVHHLVRLHSNGTIDPSFLPEHPTWVWNILPAKDGSGDLYVMTYGIRGPSSSFEPGNVMRRNADGTVDPSFLPFRGVDGPPSTFTLAEYGSGDLFVTGSFIRVPQNTIVPRPGFVRLNPDGSLDEMTPRLNSDTSPDPTSPFPQVMGPKVLSAATDGTNDWFIVTWDISPTTGTHTGTRLRRYKADGTLDPNFMAGHAGVSPVEECVLVNSHNSCAGINVVMPAPDATGDIYVAGGFATYNSVAVGHIVRINRDGTLE